MDGVNGRRFATWSLLCCLLATAGCNRFDVGPSWLPFRDEVPDNLPGVVAPQERIDKLRELAENAASADAQQRQQTSAELARSLATEEDPSIRVEIVRALGEFPGAQTDSALRGALSDSDPDVRVVACEVWGRRGDADSAALLGAILAGDVNKDVRLAAARALGQSKDPAAIAALGSALEDKNPAMQYRAVMSLREVTGKDFDQDVKRWREYVKSGSAQPDPSISVAERFRSMF